MLDKASVCTSKSHLKFIKEVDQNIIKYIYQNHIFLMASASSDRIQAVVLGPWQFCNQEASMSGNRLLNPLISCVSVYL